MNKSLLKQQLKMITSFATPYTLTDEEWIKVNEITASLERINNTQKDNVLDKMVKELTQALDNISVNSELMTAETEEQKTVKTLILLKTLLDAYNSWFKKYFGEQK